MKMEMLQNQEKGPNYEMNTRDGNTLSLLSFFLRFPRIRRVIPCCSNT